MSFTTFMGIVENGRVRLPADVVLPDHQSVLVLVPDATQTADVTHPGLHLVDPQDAAKFEMNVTWEDRL